MSWNNTIPAWMLIPEFKEATQQYKNDQITKEKAYEIIKDIDGVPERIKDNWNPNKDDYYG